MATASSLEGEAAAKVSDPHASFAAAADVALSSAAAFFSAASPPRCKAKELEVEEALGTVVETFAAGEEYGGEFRTSPAGVQVLALRKGSIAGPAALLTHFRAKRCAVVSSSTHPFVPYHHSLFALETWKHEPGPARPPGLFDPFGGEGGGLAFPKRNGRSRDHVKVKHTLATIVGPFINSYYHFVVEGLSRLVALKPLLLRSWAEGELLRLVVPAATASNAFVDRLLHVFIPEGASSWGGGREREESTSSLTRPKLTGTFLSRNPPALRPPPPSPSRLVSLFLALASV